MPEFVLLLRDPGTGFPNMGPEQMQAIVDRAIACYRDALGRARSAPEQRWLTSRLSLLV